ncbi:MAG: hypothetical protein JW810_08970 [Sedimentisphaerales bacterium]|nr:hypothetical protein [Sedimentisphaerales bacterium]
MTKAELIEAIRELNFTASVDFLGQFTEEQLQQYLEHLLEVNMEQLTAVEAGA